VTPSLPAPRRQRVTGSVPVSCNLIDGGPDPGCTPGALDSAVNQQNIGQTICVPGYTGRVRPTSAAISRIRGPLVAAYHESMADFYGPFGEIDHRIPLELGGSSAIANLWPEPGRRPNAKDEIEDRLKADVCAGRITLAEGIRRVLAWP